LPGWRRADDRRRASARRLRALDDALQRGRGRLRYDIQSFQLSPDTVPVHFVRAEWMVDGRQGFAASIWLRGEQRLEVVDVDVRPAQWLRMSEFDGAVTREHLGLVVDVFDRGHAGWGEVLMGHGGYESMSLSLLQLLGGRLSEDRRRVQLRLLRQRAPAAALVLPAAQQLIQHDTGGGRHVQRPLLAEHRDPDAGLDHARHVCADSFFLVTEHQAERPARDPFVQLD
jgi:hypothetical protein